MRKDTPVWLEIAIPFPIYGGATALMEEMN